MEPNTHSHSPADGLGTGLEKLAAAIDALEAEDLDGMSDAELIESARELGWLTDLFRIHWLRELAWVDAHGAAEPTRESALPQRPAGCRTGWG